MLLPKNVKSNRAFTLIELLLVVTIITIVSGALVPAFSKYIDRQSLKQAQEQLKSDLRTVQNKALTGSLSDALVDGNQMEYWGIKFTNGSGEYTYFIDYQSSTCPNSFVSGQDQGSGELPEGIVVQSANGCVFVDVSTGGITDTGLGGELSIGETSEDTLEVQFNSAGLIKNEGD